MPDAPANGNGRWNKWGALGGLGVLVVVVCGALLTFLMQINSMGGTVAQRGVAIEDIQRRLAAQSEAINALQVQRAQFGTQLTEIETQFCSADHIRNIMHASDLRDLAMLWHKTFGETLPTDNAYYPMICHGGRGDSRD